VPSLQAVVVWGLKPTQLQLIVSPTLMVVGQGLDVCDELQNQLSPTFTVTVAAIALPPSAWLMTASATRATTEAASFIGLPSQLALVCSGL
jgi:hypothetical protein